MPEWVWGALAAIGVGMLYLIAREAERYLGRIAKALERIATQLEKRG